MRRSSGTSVVPVHRQRGQRPGRQRRQAAADAGPTVRGRPHPRRRQRQHRRHHQEPADLRRRTARQQHADRAVPEPAGDADQRARRQPVRSRRRADEPVVGRRRRASDSSPAPATRPPSRSSGWPTSPRTWSTTSNRLENVLHIAPNAFANAYNIYNPEYGDYGGAFALPNFSNPVQFVCGAIGAVENATAPETAKLCAQYLGPALRLLNFNYLSGSRSTRTWVQSASPANIVYTDPAWRRTAAVRCGRPEPLPAVSAYTGSRRRAAAAGMGRAAGTVDGSAGTQRTAGPAVAAIVARRTGGRPVDRSSPPPAWPLRSRPRVPRHPRRARHAATRRRRPTRTASARPTATRRRDTGVMSAMRNPQRLLAIGCGVVLTATGCAFQGLNSLPLPGAVGRGSGREHLPRRDRQCRYAGIEFAGDDRRRRRRQRRQDDGAGLARRRRGVGETGRGGPGECRGHRRADQPAGLHAPGARIRRSASSRPAACSRARRSRWTSRRPTRPPSRRCRRCRPSSTAAGSGRSATSSTTSAPRCPAAKPRSAIC